MTTTVETGADQNFPTPKTLKNSQIEAIDRMPFNSMYDRVYFRETEDAELSWLFRHEVKIIRGE